MKISKSILAFICAGTMSTGASALTLSEADKTDMKLFFSAAAPPSEPINIPLPPLTLLSGKVTMPTSCKGNVGLSITNAFTDGTLKKIYENFETIVKQLASKDGAIFLASLYISKSNPNLYQLIQEGIDLGINDYLSAMGSCSAIAESLVEHVGGPLSEMQRKTKLNKIVELNAETALENDWNNIRVEELIKSGLDAAAEDGFTIFGKKLGGKNQPPIDLIDNTVKYGWCIYRGLTRDECTNFYKNANSTSELPNISETLKLITPTIGELNTAATIILGNKYISICKGCDSIDLNSYGIQAWIALKQQIIAQKIVKLSSKSIRTITSEEYESVGFSTSIRVDANYFRNLASLDRDVEVFNTYVSGWAYDVAYVQANHLMGEIRKSLISASGDKDIQDAGLNKEVDLLIETLQVEEDNLNNHSKVNNYRSKMYIERLLSAQKTRSSDKPLGAQ
ncbi:hypothetical protein [Vibrio sp. 1180_3]|uniref:hypothetical protein n=1 Tax=Vibrio sp. 1180_3 TaxID=2528832 RepID=UPI0024061901|nr:hypothetical protein [Vibrio sp. 1180_3]MDF9399160.1 hypothetical protein [Vibrio sp. 1180_3]